MVGKSSLDRRGSTPFWFVLLAIAIFSLYSMTIALTTLDKCGDLERSWKIFPPEWECRGSPTFG
jgi:hypothetical protein